MDLETSLVVTHLAATLCMVGLIWVMQVVHYPLMASVPAPAFADYEAGHTRRISWLVGPLMATELLTLVALFAVGDVVPRPLLVVDAVLLAVALTSTAVVQAPMHGRLSRGFDAEVLRRLVHTNWVRTTAWSGCGVAALAMAATL